MAGAMPLFCKTPSLFTKWMPTSLGRNLGSLKDVSKIVKQHDNILAALVSAQKSIKTLDNWKYLFKKREGKNAEPEEKIMEWFMGQSEDNRTMHPVQL